MLDSQHPLEAYDLYILKRLPNVGAMQRRLAMYDLYTV